TRRQDAQRRLRRRDRRNASQQENRCALRHGADAGPRRCRRPRHRPGAAFGPRPRWHDRRALCRRYRLCLAARRHGSRRAFRYSCRARGARGAHAPRRGSHDLRPRRAACGALGARQETGALFDGRRAWVEGYLVGRSRREFVTLVGGAAAAWSRAALAQQAAKIPVVGLLSPFAKSDTVTWHQAFLRSLQALGWTDGKNIVIEYRYAEGRNDQLPSLIAELKALKVDLIVTSVTNDTLAAKNAASDIPIVMAAAGDPVATGIVASLARPGGNVTGLSQMNIDLSGKRLELLKTVAPHVSSLAVLLNPHN